MTLFHYFDKRTGPFQNLSDISIEQAKEVQARLKAECPLCQCANRDENYMDRRKHYEDLVRNIFDEMGGKRTRDCPHYMVIEHCDWLYSWYEEPAFIKIPIEKFDIKTLSFTYGDMHPTFSSIVNDGKEYRKKLYDYNGIIDVITRHGLPQEHDFAGEMGFPYYVEVQVWSDEVIEQYQSERFWEEL